MGSARPTNAVIIAFLGFVTIVVAGIMFLSYAGRDIGIYVASLLPFVGMIGGLIGLSAKQDKTAAKVDAVATQVNGRLDAKFNYIHQHLTAAGVPDPRPASARTVGTPPDGDPA